MMIYKSALLLLCTMLVVGCSSTPPKDHYYRMMIDEAAVHKASKASIASIVVQPFQVLGLLKERGIVYVPEEGPNELRQYHYHSWIESPSILFQQLMVDFLRETNMASLVVTPEMNTRTEYELRGRVDRFELIRGESPSVMLKMELMIRSLEQQRVIYAGHYQQEIPLLNEGVQASVEALSDAVNQVYQAFINEARQQL